MASLPQVLVENKVFQGYICSFAQFFVFPGVNNCLFGGLNSFLYMS